MAETLMFVTFAGETLVEVPKAAILAASEYAANYPLGAGNEVLVPDEEGGQVTAAAMVLMKEYIGIRAGVKGSFKLRKPLHIREGAQMLVQNGMPAVILAWLDKLPWDDVFGLLNVAKALGIDELENVCCAKIASRVAMWTFQQQEAIFAAAAAKPGEPWKVLTYEEEQLLREQNKWAEGEPEITAALEAVQRTREAEEEEKKRKAAAGAGAGAGAGGAAAEEENDEEEDDDDDDEEDDEVEVEEDVELEDDQE